jgi:inhibitor of KinA
MNEMRTFPLGDSAVTVEFGRVISKDLNERAIALADHFQAQPFPGFIEAVPAYASTTLFFDIPTVKRNFPGFASAYDAVNNLIAKATRKFVTSAKPTSLNVIEIPVHFDIGSALDLEFVASHNGLEPNEVVEEFTSRTYRVFMLGFLPGFTYMGEVDDSISTPRKETPRTIVPKGSVGIAGKQTGIYSLASPGGWQIIGRTHTELFTPKAKRPTLLRAGDEVRFVSTK